MYFEQDNSLTIISIREHNLSQEYLEYEFTIEIGELEI